MTRALRRHAIVITLVAASLHSAAARADAQEKAAAESLYQEALGLMERGAFAEACPKLAESERLEPAVGTLLYLGECYDKIGHTASAWATFQSAADAARRANQPDREGKARERVEQLSARLSKFVITVAPEARVSGLEVKRDGMVVGEGSFGVGAAVDPGEHTVEATAPGRQAWSEKIRVEPGATSVTVAVPVLKEHPSRAGARPPPVPQPGGVGAGPGQPPPLIERGIDAKRGNARRIIGLALGGVGVVGLAVGTVFGLQAKSKEKDSEASCWPDDNTRCNSQGVTMINEAETAATVANIGFIGGGIALVGGAVLYLAAPRASSGATAKSRPELRLAPLVSARATWVSLQARF